MFDLDAAVLGGCGHVGLPVGLVLARRGARVALYDTDAEVVAMVRSGQVPFDEPARRSFSEALGTDVFEVTTDPAVLTRSEAVISEILTAEELGAPVGWMVAMDLAEALTHARGTKNGVLVTQRAEGRPQLSNIAYAVDDRDVIRISITADRAKAKNLARTPQASLYVGRPDFWAYVVIDADAHLSPVAAAADDATVEELVAYYRAVAGEHDDWDDYRRSMVADKRMVVRLRPTHAYGMWATS